MKKNGFFLICLVMLLFVVGCGKAIEQETFDMRYLTKGKYSDVGYISGKFSLVMDGDDTIVLPTNSKIFIDNVDLNSYFKFYDYETGQEINNISYELKPDFDNTTTGNNSIKVKGEYDGKVGTANVNVKYVEACSGECIFETSNWRVDFLDDTSYHESYSMLMTNVKMYPTSRKSYIDVGGSLITSFSTSGWNELEFDLYYGNSGLKRASGVVVSKENATEQNNALLKWYEEGKNNITDDTFLYFSLSNREYDEVYIHMYDGVTEKHNFYFIGGM